MASVASPCVACSSLITLLDRSTTMDINMSMQLSKSRLASPHLNYNYPKLLKYRPRLHGGVTTDPIDFLSYGLSIKERSNPLLIIIL